MTQTNERLEELYQYIKDCWHDDRRIPTVREMAKAQVMSVSTVSDYLSKLQAQGRITRERYKSRSIRLVDEAVQEDETANLVYEHIRTCLKAGNIPTQTEIASQCYLSRREVRRCLIWLEVQGKIERSAGQRGLRLLETA